MTQEIDATNIQGLTSRQVQELIKKYGYNELPSQGKHNFGIFLLKYSKNQCFFY